MAGGRVRRSFSGGPARSPSPPGIAYGSAVGGRALARQAGAGSSISDIFILHLILLLVLLKQIKVVFFLSWWQHLLGQCGSTFWPHELVHVFPCSPHVLNKYGQSMCGVQLRHWRNRAKLPSLRRRSFSSNVSDPSFCEVFFCLHFSSCFGMMGEGYRWVRFFYFSELFVLDFPAE